MNTTNQLLKQLLQGFTILLLTIVLSYSSSFAKQSSGSEVTGCATSQTADYSRGFDATQFTMINTSVSTNKTIQLDTGKQAIDFNNIVIPFDQQVSVTFIFEGAGYTLSDFGWLLAKEAIFKSGKIDNPTMLSKGILKEVYRDVNDNNNNGVLDVSGSDNSNRFGDTNGDGKIDVRDNTIVIGTFAGGTEIVFYLKTDNSEQTIDGVKQSAIYYTKTAWNRDTYTGSCSYSSGTFTRTFELWKSNEGCGGSTGTSGWIADAAIKRLKDFFGVEMKTGDTYSFNITKGATYPHVVIGAPKDKPHEWILGWEDLWGGGDTDYNDMVFRINRQTGGTAKLKASVALEGADYAIYASGNKDIDDGSYFTAVNIEVKDNMPCPGKTNIKYKISIDGGTSWYEIVEWDNITELRANGDVVGPVTSWRPGNPQYTYRTGRLDFAGKGISGNKLVWKAELISDDAACAPEVIMVKINGAVARNATFSRAAPVVETNVIFSGSYETPAATWTDKTLRGHLTATQIYDPKNIDKTDEKLIWDAGEVLNTRSPDSRTIYYPDIQVFEIKNEILAKGDGTKKIFRGTLSKKPMVGGTLIITDSYETFKDVRTDDLEGNFGGTGTIKRFTGAYVVEFKNPPGKDIPIKASYKYYNSSKDLKQFTPANVNNEMLAIDNTYLIGKGYVYDFNNDNAFTEADGDTLVRWIRGEKFIPNATKGAGGTFAKKEWLLGAIDHSVPALVTPPSTPQWYYGSEIDDEKRREYDKFREQHKERQSVIYVGSRGGMIHAFDAGKFRWGNNPKTSYKEYRGYFEWDVNNKPDYGTGEELWAFIPANLIPRFKNNFLLNDDQSYVDASPAIADVYTEGAWRTVLLAAEGNGGDTVFCLDVTDPYNPKFLWEFADPDLFRSISSPAVASIGRIYDIYDGQEKWAAFFVSGKSYNPFLYPSIYIINVEDGSVIKRVFLDAVTDGLGGTPSGQPAIIDSDGNGFIDRLYIGTDKGYMYKVNIPDEESSSDPYARSLGITNCVINLSLPSGHSRHPIYASPAVVVKNKLGSNNKIEYNVYVFFGTGDSPYYTESYNNNQTYYFYAYNDKNEKNNCANSNFVLQWSYQLEANHRVWASAFAAAGQVYFGTSTSETEDPCEGYSVNGVGGKGKLFAFTIEGGVKKYEKEVGDMVASPLVEDEHLYYKTSKNADPLSLGSGHYNNLGIMGGVIDLTVLSWKELDE